MDSSQRPLEPPFVVGVGASAGGLEAIERMFEGMPADSGLAFVIVQHLSPDFRSLMDEVLARWTTIPIHRVEDGMQVEANAIYLMPAKSEMVISDGRLLLKERDREAPVPLPIDHFFRSLAQDCGTRAIAVVLSGTGSDGSRGIVDIHAAGGLVLVQTEDSAKFDGMPRSARETGVADIVLHPSDIPSALTQFVANPSVTQLSSTLQGPGFHHTGLQRVFELIRDAYGLDFGYYKLSTVVRRVERRLMLRDTRHVDDYAVQLESDREELDTLYHDLLIGVTKFFRDSEAYERLATLGIRNLIERADEEVGIRVWVAGCATGEEAYSIAMLFDELLAESNKRIGVKIFATDVHQGSLEVASTGVYSEEALAGTSPGRKQRYFSRDGDGYRVSPRLRQDIVFAQHNLTKDAPFTKVDLITCRNLLIYLQPQAQSKVLSLFHFGLRANGLLFLGPSESPGEIADEFETVDAHWKLYRKRRDVRLAADTRWRHLPARRAAEATGLPAIDNVASRSTEHLLMSTYDALLSKVMPASLLFAEDGTLLYTFGDAGDYLKPEQGRTTLDVFQRLTGDLRRSVSAAVRKAFKEDTKITYFGVPVERNGEKVLHDVTATPIREDRTAVNAVLVQFRPLETPQKPSSDDERFDAGTLSNEQVSALETELRYTKENLQATIEELETSNEELQATNEELVASNEELQSTNEELHSVNEELYTVNAEHQAKIAELSELTRDMDNLLQSTEVHTVFLDADLSIRKFTPGVADTFNFLPQDVGRKIDSFTHSIEVEGLADKIRNVITTGVPYEQEVRDRADEWFLMRILPYRNSANKTDVTRGVLLTLVDITKLRQALEDLEQSVDQRDRFLAMLSHELRNPLSTVLSATHVLCSEHREGPDSEAAEIIQRHSSHMATLLDDLLDVARVSQGKIQLQRRPFELQHAVTVALESIKSRCDARHQELRADFPDKAIWICGSEPRILQVITNLLLNASKYSPDGSVIDLSITRGASEAILKVRDYGMGIAESQLGHVFDLFVQSDRTLDRADGGLGIGLTLVKSLVELHGGSVSVASDGEGNGSEFTVRIPTCEPSKTANLNVNQPRPQRQIRRVVLIEDGIDANRMLAFLLEDAGFEVSAATDGEQGLKMIHDLRPEAAVIDIGLPGRNGYDIARSIRSDESFSSVLLLALTGYGQPADRAEALSAGFDEHLVKPVDPELLIRMLGGRSELDRSPDAPGTFASS